MTWYNVVDHKYGCPACECTQTEAEIRLVRNEIRTRSVDDSVIEESAEKITSESEYCESCGEEFDQERWVYGRCQACGGAGYDCEDVSHCMHCDRVEDDCECERAECCGNFTEDCECSESDVKEKDNVIESAVQTIENIGGGVTGPDAPTPDTNRVQPPAATWTLSEDLPEE